MKKFSSLVLIFALCFVLAACGKKPDSPAPDNNNNTVQQTESYRTIQVSDYVGTIDVIRASGEQLNPYEGLSFGNNDNVYVREASNLTLEVDSDKHLFAEENTHFWMEESGKEGSTKTKIHLEEGAVLCRLENKLGADESFEIETPSSTMSVRGTVFRVAIMPMNTEFNYELVTVFDGTVATVIMEDGSSVTLEEGQCALIKELETGEEAVFVLDDEIDMEFWSNSDTGMFTVGTDGNGSPILTIPYEKLPKETVEKLIETIEDGQELVVTTDVLNAVFDTGHDYIEISRVEPTCTTTGLVTTECTLCGDHEEIVLPALGHSVVEDASVTPSCTSTGLTAGSHCDRCGTVFTAQVELAALGHESVTNADGSVTCSRCGSTLVAAPVCNHVFGSPETVEPTCTEAGREVAVCELCGYEKVTTIAALGHVTEQMKGYDALCTEPGLTGAVICTVCDAVVKEEAVIPALGHTPQRIEGTAATCTDSGLTAGSFCTVCDEILAEQEEIPALGHTEVKDEAVAATCETTGLTEGSHCSVCNEVLKEQKVVEALGHTEVSDNAVAATCTEKGLTEGTHCSVCNKVLVAQKEVAALGHVEVKDEAVAATCTADGLTEGKHCSRCNEVLKAQQTVSALGHDEVKDETVDPTCTETGLTEGKHCSRCNEVLVAQKEVAALGHSWTYTSLVKNENNGVYLSEQQADYDPASDSLTVICQVDGNFLCDRGCDTEEVRAIKATAVITSRVLHENTVNWFYEYGMNWTFADYDSGETITVAQADVDELTKQYADEIYRFGCNYAEDTNHNAVSSIRYYYLDDDNNKVLALEWCDYFDNDNNYPSRAAVYQFTTCDHLICQDISISDQGFDITARIVNGEYVFTNNYDQFDAEYPLNQDDYNEIVRMWRELLADNADNLHITYAAQRTTDSVSAECNDVYLTDEGTEVYFDVFMTGQCSKADCTVAAHTGYVDEDQIAAVCFTVKDDGSYTFELDFRYELNAGEAEYIENSLKDLAFELAQEYVLNNHEATTYHFLQLEFKPLTASYNSDRDCYFADFNINVEVTCDYPDCPMTDSYDNPLHNTTVVDKISLCVRGYGSSYPSVEFESAALYEGYYGYEEENAIAEALTDEALALVAEYVERNPKEHLGSDFVLKREANGDPSWTGGEVGTDENGDTVVTFTAYKEQRCPWDTCPVHDAAYVNTENVTVILTHYADHSIFPMVEAAGGLSDEEFDELKTFLMEKAEEILQH